IPPSSLLFPFPLSILLALIPPLLHSFPTRRSSDLFRITEGAYEDLSEGKPEQTCGQCDLHKCRAGVEISSDARKTWQIHIDIQWSHDGKHTEQQSESEPLFSSGVMYYEFIISLVDITTSKSSLIQEAIRHNGKSHHHN